MGDAAPRRERPARAAIIDLGSNALRLQIVQARDADVPVLLTRERAPVRLGRGVFDTGRIDEDCIVAAERALSRFGELCEQYGVQNVRAVATAALREAENRDAVVTRLSAAGPAPIEVISGTEEAWLLARAVTSRLDVSQGRAVLLDLGGGSVEVTVMQGGVAVEADSHPLGAVRLLGIARRRAGSDHGDAFLAALEAEAGRYDWRLRDRLGSAEVSAFVACGGNVEALADIGGVTNDGVEVLDVAALDAVLDDLGGIPPPERASRYALSSDRADVIVPAAVVLRRLASLLEVTRIVVPRVSLRDGLEGEVLMGAGAPVVREDRRRTLVASARALAERYRCDPDHAECVRRHVTALFDATAGLHGRGADDRALLEAAALLHDAGRFLSHDKHNEHGAYLIGGSAVVALGDAERSRLALIVSYHRGPHPADGDPGYRDLDPGARAGVCVLAALLRVADGLDVTHRGAVAGVSVGTGDEPGRMTLRLTPAEPDASLAAELEAARAKGGLLEDVFGIRLEIGADAA
jgi:exopolyphosphatase/guanosine-5'-triphosphate,3'-diphosphate pyrophosphatase